MLLKQKPEYLKEKRGGGGGGGDPPHLKKKSVTRGKPSSERRAENPHLKEKEEC